MALSDRETAVAIDRSLTYRVRKAVPWVILAVILFFVVKSLAGNKNLRWDRVAFYMFNSQILTGLGVTIVLTLLSGALALIIGVLLVLVSNLGTIGKVLTSAYVWLFRSVPLLVQLIIWFNFAIIVPRVRIGIAGWSLVDISTNEIITGFAASMLGLSLHEAAYFAEIIRGGLLAIPEGQYRASAALGMTTTQEYRHIIGPQLMRVTVPALTNQLISLLKSTSNVAVIGGGELLTRAQWIYSQNFQIVPLLIVVTIWYIVLVGLATLAQYFIEHSMTVKGEAKIPVQSKTKVSQPA
ncbi:MAG: amino acid ABC transporter permease [Bifidobacterium tibiigranuli]|jgi:polar amino acid transport system permease protein|uniref:amino acid ABC transporter permease n=1 Tax=Bifidobacterium tibiigranuli TaxID=2172043 RepID=UPI0026ECB225|nr:amino acid ABC transporter permease [Bifidobacterium tibiigranuli]MCI1673703.1 amino acid ABC transporter permease [Bifidobacterium tibiigranuli]MCI1712959.1 amino acid ABC transporter permease [Bifidobacterium tibiigranuli]MCI1833534.1 amino acid ABC transporter permease [Bifidobacterium tibiigranuli]